MVMGPGTYESDDGVVIRVAADTESAEQGVERVTNKVRRTGKAANDSAAQVDKFGNAVSRSGKKSARFGHGIQNAAFQVTDFAVQVESGTSATRALSQQLPQLLGAFGALGGILAAAVAILVPMIRHFVNLAKAADGVRPALALMGRAALHVLGDIADAAKGSSLLLRAGFQAAIGAIIGLFATMREKVSETFRGLINSIIEPINNIGARFNIPEIELLGSKADKTSGVLRRLADNFGEAAARSVAEAKKQFAAISDVNVALQQQFELIRKHKEEQEKGEQTEAEALVAGIAGIEPEQLWLRLRETDLILEEWREKNKQKDAQWYDTRLGLAQGYFNALVSLTGSSNRRLVAVGQSFAAITATMDAWRAFNQVLADPSLPFFAKLPAALTVLTSGLNAVNSIKQAAGGGGRSTAGAGGGGGAAAPRQTLDVTLSGASPNEFISTASVGPLLDRIIDEAGDRNIALTFG